MDRVRADRVRADRVMGPQHRSLPIDWAKVWQEYPAALDWRDIDGVSYVPTIRDQAGCGSCYAFAGIGILEMSLRIQSNNAQAVDLSEQNVVSCSHYDQGCGGGFTYLVERYTHDFGVVAEAETPYLAEDAACVPTPNARRYRAAEYGYVGGYRGNCSVDGMLSALSEGPIAISVYVDDAFRAYDGTSLFRGDSLLSGDTDSPVPLGRTNHAVILVGWGYDEEEDSPFWILRNSWGADWGIGGYMKVLMGENVNGVESKAAYVRALVE
ncbi:peptidase C1A [Kipferlia bialata]|uniref:Peptidase C1A n=1 Tax=Kipferlia bialata TaxID=797122 RepID=A0A9K3GNK4_9EUKA|nr:peptidase C1A [Kipferlia bialata]|eukprot:g11971.t1